MEINKLQPTFSMIITVGDDVRSLNRCLHSCINQSYENLEIIVSAYGKPFDTHSIASDERIVIMPTIASSISTARNRALHTAKGTYILFLESTDEIHHLWLEKALERFQISQADAVQCATVYEKEALTGAVHLPNDALLGFHQRLLFDHIIPLGSLIVKKAICKLFPEEMEVLGDWEFWIETLRNRKVDVLPEYYGHIALSCCGFK